MTGLQPPQGLGLPRGTTAMMITVLIATSATSTGGALDPARSAPSPHTSHQPTKAPPTPVGRRTHAASPTTIVARGRAERSSRLSVTTHCQHLPGSPPVLQWIAQPAHSASGSPSTTPADDPVPLRVDSDEPAEVRPRRQQPQQDQALARGRRPLPRRLDCLKVLSRSCSAWLPGGRSGP